jgi:hypothetical protein
VEGARPWDSMWAIHCSSSWATVPRAAGSKPTSTAETNLAAARCAFLAALHGAGHIPEPSRGRIPARADADLPHPRPTFPHAALHGQGLREGCRMIDRLWTEEPVGRGVHFEKTL